jgi:hypothetical protein
MQIKARTGLLRVILGSGRTAAWNKADKDFHKTHHTCEMCGSKAGTLGGLDGATGVQANLEAHDVQPYHTLTPAQQNDYNFILSNFIMLHHFEHHRIAHCLDPYCYCYDPNIRTLAATMLAAKASCQGCNKEV